MSDLPRVHHGSLLIFLACGINGESLGFYLYTRLGHEHGSLAYSWNSKKLQPRHSFWHPVEWRNFHNLPVLFFLFLLCLWNEPFLYAHWVETCYTNITSFLWPSHLYWQFWNGETRSNLCASVLANTTIREDTGSPAWRSSAKKFWWVAAGWYHYNSSHMPAVAVYLWFRYTRLLMMHMVSDSPS